MEIFTGREKKRKKNNRVKTKNKLKRKQKTTKNDYIVILQPAKLVFKTVTMKKKTKNLKKRIRKENSCIFMP